MLPSRFAQIGRGYEYHPKWTEGFAPPPMRSHDGRRINPHTVYPPENRRFFVPSGYPNNCIGHLVVTEPGRPSRIGTATLVGSRVILTAAHLAPTDGNPGRWGAFFVPGYMFGNSIVQMASWCEAYRLATVSVTDETQAFDVMVMKLYDPLGDALGFFGARTYDSDWEDESRWTLVGYPGIAAGYQYNGEFPTIETGIRVIDDDPDGSFAEIEHMGDASDGNSGGPLFGIWPDGPYIIGVHSGAEDRTYLGVVAENNNVAAGGSGMVAMIRQARTDWPT